MTQFKTFTDLVNHINADLGDFCKEFQYKRKDLSGKEKATRTNKLFGNIKEDGFWAINQGGGTEIQYHLGWDRKNQKIRYGLGFNTQYVPFATNTKTPIFYAKPFMKAFLQLEDQIKKELPDYDFVIGNRSLIENPQLWKFVLFGKTIEVSDASEQIEIHEDTYQQLIEDLKRQFKPYVEIFELRNQLKTQNMVIESMKQLLKNKKQIILQGAPGTGKTRLAKELAHKLLFKEDLPNEENKRQEQLKKMKESGRYFITQFHPSYSYEDFVRGIEVKNEDSTIEYKTKNKLFAEIAEKAQKNEANKPYFFSKKDFEQWIEPYKEHLREYDAKDVPGNYYVSEIREDGIDYRKHEWSESKEKPHFINNARMISIANEELGDGTKENYDLFPNGLKSAYFDFEEFFLKHNPIPYVLIIDEINRANLPAVLGELIYALEYRGEPVESMYEIEDEEGSKSNQIIIPKNLFIIGTMNTADRSVGHIDYAIRRRFAFVDVLPTIEPLHSFAEDLFFKVAGLFIKNPTEVDWQAPLFEPSEYLSPEFRPEDVMIGHSYFITSDDGEKGKQELDQRFRYEILPILKEYLKDGVLLPDAENEIKNLHAAITQ